MRKTVFIFLMLLTLWSGSGWAINEHEMPFGTYFSRDAGYFSVFLIDSLREKLGFNFVQMSQIDTSLMINKLNDFYAAGIQSVIDNANYAPPTKYSGAGYAIVQAEDSSSEIRFLVKSGRVDGNWFVTALSGIVLDNLWFKQLGKLESLYGPQPIEHQRTLRISIDRAEVDSTDTLAVFRLWNAPNWWQELHDNLIDTTLITADSFYIAQSDTILWHFNPYRLSKPGHNPICFQLEASGACSLRVDYLEIFDYEGIDLLFNHQYDNEIKQYAASPWAQDKVLGWYLRDEPLFDQYRAAGYIAPMIADTTFKAFGDTAYGFTCFAMPVSFSLRDFFKVASPRILWTDHYPLSGGQVYQDTSGIKQLPRTHYYGDYGRWYSLDQGLQASLNDNFIYLGVDSVRAAFRAAAQEPEWWVFIQCVGDMKLGQGYSNDFCLRPPVPTELSCMTFMALAYGAKGILYWPFDAYYNYPFGTYMIGICDTLGTGFVPTSLYGKIEHDINPYIKAIDSTLLELSWDTSYYACDTHYVFSGTLVSSIHGWSDSPNPDSGWAQIGEFHDNSAQYIMLVNRACSSDDQGTEAPPQHFTLKLNSGTIGSNYVLITDLADSLYHPCDTCDWVGIPKTTYSSQMDDGTIPYTVTLKAGEGKLFKIARAH